MGDRLFWMTFGFAAILMILGLLELPLVYHQTRLLPAHLNKTGVPSVPPIINGKQVLFKQYED